MNKNKCLNLIMYNIYCLNYSNTVRRASMSNRFANVGARVCFSDGVPLDDSRIAGRGLIDHTQKCWSCMYGHLDMIREFLVSDAQIGIFCEDDILIDADFVGKLEHVIGDFIAMDCDTMLLGYLVGAPISEHTHLKTMQSIYVNLDSGDSTTFKYFEYGMDIWGTQMYMLSRSEAQRLIAKYGDRYADAFLANPGAFELPFSADWTLTKDGAKRCLVYPMLAIEDGLTRYDHDGQTEFHRLSHSAHVNASCYQ